MLTRPIRRRGSHRFRASEHDWYWFEVIIDRTSAAAMPELGGIKAVEYD